MQLSQQPGALNDKHSLRCRWKAPSDVGMQLPLYSFQTLWKHYLQQRKYSSATNGCVKTKMSSIRKLFSPVDASVHSRSDCITHITLPSCASKYITQMGYSFTDPVIAAISAQSKRAIFHGTHNLFGIKVCQWFNNTCCFCSCRTIFSGYSRVGKHFPE